MSLLTVASPVGAQVGPPTTAEDGPALYGDACAGCHGLDGTGSSAALLAFEEDLPDFTDCSFASREPVADWVAVAHQGGPVRGFSRMMPAFGEALDPAALERIVVYVASLCDDDAWPRGELNLPRPLFTEKAYPEDEWVLESDVSLEGPATVGHRLVYEKRFGPRTQVEVALPFGYRERSGTAVSDRWVAGFGDLTLGVKHALSHGLESGHILSAIAEVKLATGDGDDGFSAGSTVLEGFLAFAKLLPSDAFLQLQAGAERPTRSGAETELFWTGLIGRTFTEGEWGRAWSPMVEVLGAFEEGEGPLWDLAPQLHLSLNTRQHVMMTLGPRIPLSGPDRPVTFAVNLLWDWFDGGLLEGW